jgi:phosphoribosylformylglycinamidine synthase
MASVALKAEGEVLVLVGDATDGPGGWLGQSLYLREIEGREDGAPPPVDLELEKRNGDFVRDLIADGSVVTCQDVSDGGMLVAVAEMALAGDLGATLEPPRTPDAGGHAHAWLFGEDQGRYVLSIPESQFEPVARRAASANVALRRIGVAGGRRLTVNPSHSISLDELRDLHEGWLPGYMAGQAGGAEGQG